MSRYKFKEDEVPYAILEQFGLSQEMIEDLPTDVYHDILSGRLSPVLPISVKDKKGRPVSARARFKLVRDADDEADIVFHPRLVHCDLNLYTYEEAPARPSSATRPLTRMPSASSRSIPAPTRSSTCPHRSSARTSVT